MENKEVRPATGASVTRFLVVMGFILGAVLLIVQIQPATDQERRQRAEARAQEEKLKPKPPRPTPLIGVRFEGILVESKKQQITKDDWGDEWPLAVDEATVVCVPQFSAVNGGTFLIADDRAFSLTGSTQTLVRARKGEVLIGDNDRGYERPVPFTGDDPHSDRLWLKMPDQGDGLPWRVNISPVLDAAIALCKV